MRKLDIKPLENYLPVSQNRWNRHLAAVEEAMKLTSYRTDNETDQHHH